jgi:L-fuculose-phosphate aldolase
MRQAVLKQQVLFTACTMNESGINRGSSGNVSARNQQDHRDGFVITPTGIPYEKCSSDDMVNVGMDGTLDDTKSSKRKPSSEWRFHRDIYQAFPEAGAVVHAHSAFATSLACMGIDIPPFHYMVARFGGDNVRCASYATFGSQELSDAMIVALRDRRACLMAHHGMVIHGRNLEHALALAVELEALCEQYWRVLQIGQPKLLSDEEMQRVLEKFSGYGQQ